MEKLGIDIRLIISQVVNFFILFFLLKKLLYKPLLDLFAARKKAIEETLKNLEESKRKLAETENSSGEIISNAQKKGNEIILFGKKKADELTVEIMDKAREQAQKAVHDAQISTEEIIETVTKKVQERTGYMVLETTKKIFQNLDEEQRKKITEQMLKKLT